MKVKVNRLLTAGKYHVNFEVGEFTPEELSKMSSFGVPSIQMQYQTPNGPAQSRFPLNRITNGIDATFDTDQLAKEYESKVLTQVRSAMEKLRASQDEFTSTEEVEL